MRKDRPFRENLAKRNPASDAMADRTEELTIENAGTQNLLVSHIANITVLNFPENRTEISRTQKQRGDRIVSSDGKSPQDGLIVNSGTQRIQGDHTVNNGDQSILENYRVNLNHVSAGMTTDTGKQIPLRNHYL
jgi:hypothetical protein